ncbi:MAG: hypothetical protein J5800_04605 [Spirochaetales bacterium]|nr:hypothetical protein [Spirochaetales bacterium]
MEGNAVKKHLIELIRQRLAEHDLFISDETLEYTAERYAWLIMDNPTLSVSKLLDQDILKLQGILKEVNTPKAG